MSFLACQTFTEGHLYMHGNRSRGPEHPHVPTSGKGGRGRGGGGVQGPNPLPAQRGVGEHAT